LSGQLFGQLEAMAGKVPGRAVDALLEDAAGVEGVGDGVGVAGEGGLALQLKVGGQGAQAAHLVADLAGCGVGGLAETGVLGLHPVEQEDELGVESRARGLQLALAFDGHGAGGQQLRQRG